MNKIDPKKLKDVLGVYLPLLIYPQDDKQEKLNFPFTTGYWRQVLARGLKVSTHRIKVIRKNISKHISLLEDIDKQLMEMCSDTYPQHTEEESD